MNGLGAPTTVSAANPPNNPSSWRMCPMRKSEFTGLRLFYESLSSFGPTPRERRMALRLAEPTFKVSLVGGCLRCRRCISQR